jgi:hypothetical protein
MVIETFGLRMRCDRTPADVVVDDKLTDITCGTSAIQLVQASSLSLSSAIVGMKENVLPPRAVVREQPTVRGYRIEYVTPRAGKLDYSFIEIVAVGKKFYACEVASRATENRDGDPVEAARASAPV